MNHATDGLLQAYADGEIEGAAAADLLAHLDACERCAHELDELRHLSARMSGALMLVDAPAPTLRTRAALAAARRGAAAPAPRRTGFHGWSLARAAMLLLVLGGAVAAAIPGSPLRPLIERGIARLLDREPVPVPPVVEPVAEVPVARTEIGVAPADGRVRILLHSPARLDVAVRLADIERARVETIGGNVDDLRRRVGPGRLEVFSLTDAEVVITVPLTVTDATIEVDGQVYVFKQGAALNLSGPAGTARGGVVNFRIER